MARTIDLNSDLGEGAGADEALMPLITSANIACGAHAGDEPTMRATVALALRHGVAIGAHPGYRDRANFGRIAVELPGDALFADVRDQIELLRRVAGAAGGTVTHVKAHGALYNRAERDDAVAGSLVDAIRAVHTGLVLVASPGSAMARCAMQRGLRVVCEGFVDRAYEANGTLRSRRSEGALITDPATAAAQALALAREGTVRAYDGRVLQMPVDTLCLHGDTPGAPAIASAVRDALAEAGIGIRAFRT